ncbi:MAG: hypothetical protein ICV68_01395 [Pyrinomonadaceae bacterium]|nr:hypothetical protein [Pyrinomonadaceae bacterium]
MRQTRLKSLSLEMRPISNVASPLKPTLAEVLLKTGEALFVFIQEMPFRFAVT